MKIDILCVGKIKEKYWTDAMKEYEKRLSKYIKLEIIEVKDEKTPDKASKKEEQLIMTAEANRLRKHISKDALVICLAIEGKQHSSEEFSKLICKAEENAKTHIQFVIGGSLGIEEEFKKMSFEKISFSKMTFPHQMMRVILLEQIYRAYKIKTGEPYHK